ncbi:alpha/beta hydrolase [Amycolatopsis benzoatilytica]|uniref:alpha/beta hydrolase n=1 Tax=Amycolatopsis benzoatilytica TaxID=346045 RepID=UPI000376556F|nr:alpha/beta hydrolase [Amycolatopsis benzoatilytica]
MTRPLFVVAAVAALGAAAIQAATVPTLWSVTPAYAALFAVLALGQAISLVRAPWAVSVVGTGFAFWVMDRVLHVLPGPSPWRSADTALGVTDWFAAVLQGIALAGLLTVVLRHPRPARARWARVSGWLAAVPAAVLAVALATAGTVTAAAGATASGNARTVEYCRPDGIPLRMDLYSPAVPRRVPVALYVHGGGFVLGDRKPDGTGAVLANSDGALFPSLQRELTSRGFLVASIDYRLAPAAAWPAPIVDAKCAVRFLKAHAGEFGIDPGKIGVWGSSAGGTLSALLGTAGPDAGFDTGQYLEQTSAVAAVVDMFGPADLAHLEAAEPVQRLIARIGLGTDPSVRRSGSPDSYVSRDAAPILILQGDEDFVRPQSTDFATRLRAAGTRVTLVPVHGTGHTLDTPGQNPGSARLTTMVADFLSATLC